MSCSTDSAASTVHGSTDSPATSAVREQTDSAASTVHGSTDSAASSTANRVARLKAAISATGARAAYIRDTPNIEWITAFRGVFDDESAHALFCDIEASRAKVYTDSRYSSAMERASIGTPFEVELDSDGMSKWLSKIWDSKILPVDAKARLAIETSMSLAEFRKLEELFSTDLTSAQNTSSDCDSKSHNPFIETENLVLKLRAIKDASEIKLLREAQAITDEAFTHILGFIKPGLTEREIQLELDDFMMRSGADSLAFPSIVASGPNGASPHALVSEKRVELGECIVLDFGARKNGYCSDMTRVVFLGEPTPEMSKAWDTLRRANETVQEKLRPGMTGKEAHEMALEILDKGGYAGRMGHGLGHGVGIQIHELPNLSPRNDAPLVAGNVVTVEPGIYIPGEFGMRLEDFGVVTEDGFERFTNSTHEMVVVG